MTEDSITYTEICDECEGGFILETLGQGLCPACQEVGDTHTKAQTTIESLVLDYSSDLEDCRGWAEDAIELLTRDRLSKKARLEAINALEHLRKLATDNAPDPSDYVL